MAQIISKMLQPIYPTCQEYVHPWTSSCAEASAGLYLYAIMDSMRIYSTVYVLALLSRGRIPNFDDIKRTIYGILQSTAFLSATACGYSMFLCSLRRLMGHYNILTISAVPSFLSSVFTIIIERPSRRTLLALYVSNVATETVWNMLLYRNMVKSIKHGEVLIFTSSIALLLAMYKGGQHKNSEKKNDSMFGVLRFVVGPYEEKDYSEQRSIEVNSFRRVPNNPSDSSASSPGSSAAGSLNNRRRIKPENTIYHLVTQALRAYKKLIYKIKCTDRHVACPHPFSCLYYTLQGTTKMVSVGLGIQLTIKLLLNIKKIIKRPLHIKDVLFRRDTLSLAAFLGGFSGMFRGISCLLRRIRGKDSALHALPAGFIAGIAFMHYPDTTVALYVFWKMLQIVYNLGIDRKILPKVPGFTIFLYCFSTSILFHAALVEPLNLRSSYWKFLHSMSGGRVAAMGRTAMDAWGLETSKALEIVLKKTKTTRDLKYIPGTKGFLS